MTDIINESVLTQVFAHKSNMILMLMIISYVITILYVVKTYNSNKTVSGILLNPTIKKTLWGGMITMGFFTMLYEWERGSPASMGLIGVVLLGIYGLLYYDEGTDEHIVFTSITAIGIVGFMAFHAFLIDSPFLQFLVCLEIILIIEVVANIHNDIFKAEVGYIANFAGYYLYLHTLLDSDATIDTLIPV
jgi:hypothetical protein